MSGYRGGTSQSLSTRDFNERAKALSERLGPVEKPAKEPRGGQPRRQNFKFGARAEPTEPAEPTEAAEPEAPAASEKD
jgi:hypothetical protein